MSNFGVPKCFWGECFLMVTYLMKELPSRILNWKSPYEILCNTPPDYTSIKSFGCLMYYANIKPHKDKFEPRGRKGLLIGFSIGQKGFKIYDFKNHKIVVSRDVKFHEDIYPMMKVVQTSSEVTVPLFFKMNN